MRAIPGLARDAERWHQRSFHTCVLGHPLLGRKQVVGGLSVIGEQEQPFGVLVQPSHRKRLKQGVFRLQELNHGLRDPVRRGGNHSGGLVHHQVDKFPVLDVQAVHFDAVLLRVHVHPRVFGHFAVDGHSPLFDQFPDLLPRPDTHPSEQFVEAQPLFRHPLASVSRSIRTNFILSQPGSDAKIWAAPNPAPPSPRIREGLAGKPPPDPLKGIRTERFPPRLRRRAPCVRTSRSAQVKGTVFPSPFGRLNWRRC
jgi:hypothetical protein